MSLGLLHSFLHSILTQQRWLTSQVLSVVCVLGALCRRWHAELPFVYPRCYRCTSQGMRAPLHAFWPLLILGHALS